MSTPTPPNLRLAAVPVAVVLSLTALSGLASTNNFIVPSFRGQTDTEIGFWERFTVPYGAPGNTADQAGSNSGAVVTQILGPSAFATGSGNLYDPAAAMAFTLTDATPFTLGTVVLQIRTLGSELDYGAVRLTYNDAGGSHTVDPLYRVELDRGTLLGASVSSLWQWDLRELDVMEYSIAFGTPDSSLSLDAITVDAWTGFLAVPEPSILGLFVFGTFLLRGFGRRRSMSPVNG